MAKTTQSKLAASISFEMNLTGGPGASRGSRPVVARGHPQGRRAIFSDSEGALHPLTTIANCCVTVATAHQIEIDAPQ